MEKDPRNTVEDGDLLYLLNIWWRQKRCRVRSCKKRYLSKIWNCNKRADVNCLLKDLPLGGGKCCLALSMDRSNVIFIKRESLLTIMDRMRYVLRPLSWDSKQMIAEPKNGIKDVFINVEDFIERHICVMKTSQFGTEYKQVKCMICVQLEVLTIVLGLFMCSSNWAICHKICKPHA